MSPSANALLFWKEGSKKRNHRAGGSRIEGIDDKRGIITFDHIARGVMQCGHKPDGKIISKATNNRAVTERISGNVSRASSACHDRSKWFGQFGRKPAASDVLGPIQSTGTPVCPSHEQGLFAGLPLAADASSWRASAPSGTATVSLFIGIGRWLSFTKSAGGDRRIKTRDFGTKIGLLGRSYLLPPLCPTAPHPDFTGQRLAGRLSGRI